MICLLSGLFSGTETYLKVGGTRLVHVRRKAPDFFCRNPPVFSLYTSKNSRFGERFRGGQYSFVSFLFAVLLLKVLPVTSRIVPLSRM